MTHHEWGWMLVVDLFLGGLGAGCLVLSAFAHLSGRRCYLGIARAGALLAPVLVGTATGLLVFDLGNPLRAWLLFTTVNPVSPMSIGSWLILLFCLVSLANAVLHLPTAWAAALAARLGPGRRFLERLAGWNGSPGTETESAGTYPGSPGWVRLARNALAVLGIPVGLGVGIYTGVLLGAIPARPFWNTPMVAQLFLFSAISTAAALLMLAVPRIEKRSDEHRRQQHDALHKVVLLFILLELFIITPFVIHGELSTLSQREALNLILGGPYTGAFWVGVVGLGILLPALALIADAAGGVRRLPGRVATLVRFAVPVLILVGGYLLRWVFIHAGQDSHFI